MVMSPIVRLGLVVSFIAIATGNVLAKDAGGELPPLSPVLRQNENWADFHPAADDPFYLQMKHITLSDDDSVWLSLGGQLRMRGEYWDGFGFRDNNADSFLLTRLRFHADLHVGPQLRFFVEGKSALATDRDLPGGDRSLDRDELDLQQGFADFTWNDNDLSLRVRGGRQMLLFGKQRLVSPLDWSNTMRAWDGLDAKIQWRGWSADVFFTEYVNIEKYAANDHDLDESFYGIYATGPIQEGSVNADVYWLRRERGITRDFRHTLGARLFGKCGDSHFDYDIEGAYQFGEAGSLDVSAFMIGAEVGYTFAQVDTQPRVWLGFDYGSGDDSQTDGDLNTFDQLYPLGHAYLGYIDVVGRQNILDLNAGVKYSPVDKLALRLAGHLFWRADDADALYNAGGGVVRPGGTTSEKFVGAEIDLTASYQLNRYTSLLAGYSHFFAGPFVERTGSAQDIDFVYVQAQVTF